MRRFNLEVDFGRFNRPNDIDRIFIYRVEGFFTIAFFTAQEENPPMETAPVRKVVQISTMVHPEKDWAFIALCDDGSLWLYHGSWSQIQNIPQTTDL